MQSDIEERRMAIARRFYSTFYTEMKSAFLEEIAAKNIVKNNLIESRQFILFEKVCGFVSEFILTEIRCQFRMNNINSLSEHDISDRVESLWNETVKIFDEHYKTKLKPNRTRIYDMFDDKKNALMNILKKIYYQAKEIKIKK